MLLERIHIFQFSLAVIISLFITLFNGKFIFSEFIIRTCIVLLGINAISLMFFQYTQDEFIDNILSFL